MVSKAKFYSYTYYWPSWESLGLSGPVVSGSWDLKQFDDGTTLGGAVIYNSSSIEFSSSIPLTAGDVGTYENPITLSTATGNTYSKLLSFAVYASGNLEWGLKKEGAPVDRPPILTFCSRREFT